MNIFIKLLYQASRLILQLIKPMTNGVRLLLVRDDQVLLANHVYENEWTLPGGLVEKGEILDSAARRKSREEVGATFTDLELFGIHIIF